MLFIAIGDHHPSMCPSTNKQVFDMISQSMEQMQGLADQLKVKLVGAYSLAPQHRLVIIIDAPDADAARQMIMRSRLANWNDLALSPAMPVEDAIRFAGDLLSGKI